VQTIDGLIGSRCASSPERTALRQKAAGVWRETSYGELWRNAGRTASGLQRRGLRPGDHVALLAPSSPGWVESYLGILRAGGVVVPIDKELKSSEIRHILTDCGARIVFTDSPCLDAILDSLPALPNLQTVIMLHPLQRLTRDPRTEKALEALLGEWRDLVTTHQIPQAKVAAMEILAAQVHKLLSGDQSTSRQAGEHLLLPPALALQGNLTREGKLIDLVTLQCDEPPLPSQRKATDTAVILYTSGTTGRSKGAMLSHANIVSNLRGAAAHFSLDDSIHTLSFLPINHVFEQVAGVLLPLSLGGKVSFAESLKKLGENLAEVKPTFLLGVPAVYKMILDRIQKNVEARKLTKLLYAVPVTRPLVRSQVKKTFGGGTIFISGGAALDPAIARGLRSYGIPVFQGYGITETSPVISAENPQATRLGTVGVLFPEVAVQIAAPNEEQIGEILVKGPNVMQGYYKNPQATVEVLHDGWYHTGDLGRLDSDGYLSICGRVKNVIVTPNGKNVYPEEVENELLKSRYIAEAMVYGHKVGPLAEEVHAIIHPNQEELDNYARKHGLPRMSVRDVEKLIRDEVLAAGRQLADYKRVKRFTLREDEFPKTTTRKIQRFAVEASVSIHD
jgi:long-chain acyl-CoA synthetase